MNEWFFFWKLTRKKNPFHSFWTLKTIWMCSLFCISFQCWTRTCHCVHIADDFFFWWWWWRWLWPSSSTMIVEFVYPNGYKLDIVGFCFVQKKCAYRKNWMNSNIDLNFKIKKKQFHFLKFNVKYREFYGISSFINFEWINFNNENFKFFKFSFFQMVIPQTWLWSIWFYC